MESVGRQTGKGKGSESRGYAGDSQGESGDERTVVRSVARENGRATRKREAETEGGGGEVKAAGSPKGRRTAGPRVGGREDGGGRQRERERQADGGEHQPAKRDGRVAESTSPRRRL